MSARRQPVAFLAGVLVAGPSWADSVSRDVGTGAASTRLGPATLTLGEAEPFAGDPFALPVRTWLPPLPTAGNVPLPPFHRSVVPELTLVLRPVLGLEPFVQARTFAPFQSGSTLDSDFGFRFRAGRFHAGARMSFVRDRGGLALETLSYARYVAPTYHLGLTDDARFPLLSGVAVTHRLTASLGLKPTAEAPAFRVSSSVRDAGAEPRFAAGMFGRF